MTDIWQFKALLARHDFHAASILNQDMVFDPQNGISFNCEARRG